MQGLTVVIVGFFLLCVAFPRMVKNRTQFYGAFVLILLTILLQSLAMLISSPEKGLYLLLEGLAGLVQLVTLIILVLASGGLSLHELTGEMSGAIEIMRRGDTEKTILFPQARRQQREQAAESEGRRYEINEPEAAPEPPPPSQKSDSDGPIPLE